MSELIFASFRLLFPVRFAHRMCGCAALPGSSLADVKLTQLIKKQEKLLLMQQLLLV